LFTNANVYLYRKQSRFFNMTIDPKSIPTKDLHQFILGAVAPRPIAFASTISIDGVPNLAPYSFFNAFSSNPPILIFSSNRRVANNTTKDTLKNCVETGEVVINVVSHEIMRQMALTSVEYPADVDEFVKAGFTPLPSDLVKPFRVAESPVSMECKVEKILPLGEDGGAGNLVFCHIVRMHIADRVLSDKGRIDPHKIDLVGRMGRFYYARASGAAVEELAQEVTAIGMGFDALPPRLRHSKLLTGSNLAELAALSMLPSSDAARQTLLERGISTASVGDLELLCKSALDREDIALGAALASLMG
jgi:flavin reductase (DIM6/NTAB) family NADH-FMN oxidoreductase RutF